MKSLKLAGLVAAVLIGGISGDALARDDRLTLNVSDFMARQDVQSRLGTDVKFFFGTKNHPRVTNPSAEFQSNKKTNAFNKTDQEACEWALLSAMLAMKQRALQLGGNAVINITSNYRGQAFDSKTSYHCGAGAMVAGVTIKGQAASLK